MPTCYPLRTNHPELQRYPQIRTTCLNSEGGAYVKDGGPPPRQISVATFGLRLASLDVGHGSIIRQNAQTIAAGVGLEPIELLHMAICRAAKPKASRPDMSLVPYLTMLMRSIASGIAKARRRAAEHGTILPYDYVHEQVPSTGSIQDPVRTIHRAADQTYFADLLEELHHGDPMLEGLVDAIGMNWRGNRIQQELGVGTIGLATLRRRLKRKASHIVAREGLRFDCPAGDNAPCPG